MTQEHAPTPYNMAPRTNYYVVDGSETERAIMIANGVPLKFEAISIGGGKTNHTICLVPLDESSLENAAFIVRACNAHDALMETANNLAGNVRAYTGGYLSGERNREERENMKQALDVWVDAVYAALAKACGKA